MINKIEILMVEVDNLTANSAEELEALRIKYLSKNDCCKHNYTT